MHVKATRSLLLTLSAAIALVVTGCGGGGDGRTVTMPEPVDLSMQEYDPSLEGWDVIRSEDLGPVGVEHSDYGLRVWFDDSLVPHISSPSPASQPILEGTWSGEWAAYLGQVTTLHTGAVRVDVTLDADSANAVLSYHDVPGFGNISSNMMPITDGAFAGTETVAGALGSFNVSGQFGGSNQQGVAGYVHGPGFYSVFHGER